VSTSESAAEILARNIAFFEQRTAPRSRPPVVPAQPLQTERTLRPETAPRR
jgi:hypothetical protein